jgi:hypothetical protein
MAQVLRAGTSAGLPSILRCRLVRRLVAVSVLGSVGAVASAAADGTRHSQNTRNELRVAADQLCPGVSPTGKIIYFQCAQLYPGLACSTVTTEGEIVYISCSAKDAVATKNE